MAKSLSKFLMKLEELKEQETQVRVQPLEEKEDQDDDEESSYEITERFKCMNLSYYFTRRAEKKQKWGSYIHRVLGFM